MQESESPLVVLFSSDLMLISSVGGAATAAGHRFCSSSRLSDVVEKLEAGSMLCLDLSSSGADPQEVASAISTELLQGSVAFGPHVHVATLERARQAGFARVMSRGQFVSKLAELFSRR